MDIYLTNLTTSGRLQFPMLPTEITIKMSHQMATYSILRVGEVKIPSGVSVDSYSWSGKFPGYDRRNDPYIRTSSTWLGPKANFAWINNLKVKDDKPVKLRLLITETPINCDVYLSSFTAKHTGGYGDIDYSITLTEARDIIVRKSSQSETTSESTENAGTAETPTAQTYTVAKGDSLWKIAQKVYGKGSDYTKLYEANKSTIGSNPNLIYPGQVFTIP